MKKGLVAAGLVYTAARPVASGSMRQMDSSAFWDGIAEKYAKQPVANPDSFEAEIAFVVARKPH